MPRAAQAHQQERPVGLAYMKCLSLSIPAATQTAASSVRPIARRQGRHATPSGDRAPGFARLGVRGATRRRIKRSVAHRPGAARRPRAARPPVPGYGRKKIAPNTTTATTSRITHPIANTLPVPTVGSGAPRSPSTSAVASPPIGAGAAGSVSFGWCSLTASPGWSPARSSPARAGRTRRTATRRPRTRNRAAAATPRRPA